MAKGDKNNVQNQIGTAQGNSSSVGNQLMNNSNAIRFGTTNGVTNSGPTAGADGTFNQGQTERNSILGGYNGLMGNLTTNPLQLSSGVTDTLNGITTPQLNTNSPSYSGYAGLAGGNFNTSPITSTNSGYAGLTNPQGGISDDLYNGISGDISGLTGIGNSSIGAYNPTDVNTAEGAISGLTGVAGGYGNFAQTGGMTPQDIQNFTARSNSVIPSYYANEQNNLATLANRTGGSNPYATSAAMAQLARQGSNAASGAAQQTQVNLNQLINQNKLAGLAGQSSTLGSQAQLASALAQGEAASRLYGLTGAANAGQSLANSISQNKLAGLAGMSQNNLNATQLGLQAQLAGLTGMSQQDLANLQAQLQGNQLTSQNQQFIGSSNLNAGLTQQQQQLGALSGLTGLYNSSYAPDVQAQNMGFAQNNANNANTNQLLQLLMGSTNIPSNWQTALGNIGSIAGLVGGGLGAFSSGVQGGLW